MRSRALTLSAGPDIRPIADCMLLLTCTWRHTEGHNHERACSVPCRVQGVQNERVQCGGNHLVLQKGGHAPMPSPSHERQLRWSYTREP